jgi:hypothetical protein
VLDDSRKDARIQCKTLIFAYVACAFPSDVFHLDKIYMTDVARTMLDSAREFTATMDSMVNAVEAAGFHSAVEMGLATKYDKVLWNFLDAYTAWRKSESTWAMQQLKAQISMLYDEYCEVRGFHVQGDWYYYFDSAL